MTRPSFPRPFSHSFPHSFLVCLILAVFTEIYISEWGIKRERKKEWNKTESSSGVRRGVWHPLSCLLKARFFPLLPPPHSADHRYFQRLHSAAAYLAVLLKGSQKLKLWALISRSREGIPMCKCMHERLNRQKEDLATTKLSSKSEVKLLPDM